jgi:hypothetical protein
VNNQSQLNESVVEVAVLEWFGELGYAIGHGPHIAPGEPAAEYHYMKRQNLYA